MPDLPDCPLCGEKADPRWYYRRVMFCDGCCPGVGEKRNAWLEARCDHAIKQKKALAELTGRTTELPPGWYWHPSGVAAMRRVHVQHLGGDGDYQEQLAELCVSWLCDSLSVSLHYMEDAVEADPNAAPDAGPHPLTVAERNASGGRAITRDDGCNLDMIPMAVINAVRDRVEKEEQDKT